MITIAKQIAVFMDNRPGTLARFCQGLAKAHVNILGLSISEAIDHAVVRLVVDKPKEAEQALSALRAMTQSRDVVFMDVENKPGEMARIAEQLAAAGINIEYAYCTASPSHSAGAIILRTTDLEATISALS